MTEAFTDILIEVKQSNGTWFNLTPDVKQNPPPRVSGMGGLGFGITDRIGGVGVFTFTLDNSAANSVGILGYYTPGGVNSGEKILPKSQVRVSFAYDGWRRYKYFGRVDQDGIAVAPGQYRERSVSVRCSNWMAEAARHKVDLLGYELNRTYDAAFRTVLNNMSIQPQNIKFFEGTQNFPTVFDTTRTNTTALGELSKLVFSEWGRAYIAGDDTQGETLVLEDFYWYSRESDANRIDPINGDLIPKKQSDITSVLTLMTGSNLTLMTGSTLLLNEKQNAAFTEAAVENMQWHYGQNVYDRVTFKTYPRDIQTSQILWSMAEPIELTAGQQLTDVRGSYTDPSGGFAKVNGLNDTMSTTYAAFEFSDGTGTDYTTSVIVAPRYGTAEVEYTLTNNAGVTVYVTQLQAEGSGVFIYDANDKTFNAPDGQGISPVEIDLPYLTNVNDILWTAYADTAWDSTLYWVQFPQPTITGLTMTVNKTSKQMLAFLHLEPRGLIIVDETMTDRGGSIGGYTTAWHIQSYDFEIINGDTVKWYLNLKFAGVA